MQSTLQGVPLGPRGCSGAPNRSLGPRIPPPRFPASRVVETPKRLPCERSRLETLASFPVRSQEDVSSGTGIGIEIGSGDGAIAEPRKRKIYTPCTQARRSREERQFLTPKLAEQEGCSVHGVRGLDIAPDENVRSLHKILGQSGRGRHTVE